MANLFDVYNDGSLIDHTEGEKLETGETPITITGLTAYTTYDKVQVAFAGSYNKADVPSFKTESGRNLLLGTADWSGGSTRWNQRASVTENTYLGMVIAATSKAFNNTPIYVVKNAGILQVGKTYTFSTYIRNTSDTDAKIGYYYDAGMMTPGFVDISLPAHTDWTRIFVTFQIIKDPTTTINGLRWEPKQDVTNGEIQVAGYKLEEGNKATPWIPAPEDNVT